MGYDFHITRRRDWSDKGRDITASEWLAYVQNDSELHLQPENGAFFAEWSGPSELNSPWLDWSHGQIYTKNPDPAVIDKMVAIARQFDASVQGDDGEIYEGGSVAPWRRGLSLRERVAGWFASLRIRSPLEVEHEPLPFGVGDRVHDIWGNQHTVIEIDPKGLGGMGLIRTRRDDGMEIGHTMTSHVLEAIADKDIDNAV